MHKQFRRWVFGMLLLLVLCLLPHTALASIYGRGVYGDCTYAECASTSNNTTAPPPTQTSLPSGLEVSINLTNGQTIPADGYTIIITPLNGQGSSFDRAEIYIDGQLVATVSPDSTGTARWQWDVQKQPGSVVKIIIYGKDGSSVTREFTVKIGPESPPAPATNTPKKTETGNILQQVYERVQEAIRALPKPIIYSFPYILFILLSSNLVLLLLQVKRELREHRLLQLRLEREEAAAEAKRTLLELVSHYLRTPFTVIQGGIGLLQKADLVQSDMINLSKVTDDLQATIEKVINQMRTLTVATMPSGVQAMPPFWRQTGLVLPIVLIGVITVAFNVLAQQAGSFSANEVTIGVQSIIFLAIALGTYQVFRRLQLRRRDTSALQRVIAQEAQTNQARDDIIDNAYMALKDDFAQLDTLVPKLSNSPAGKFVRAGQTDYHDLFVKFGIAARLRGSRSQHPPVDTSWHTLVTKAYAGLAAKASAKQITLADQPGSTPVRIQEPELLVFALRTILDNALEYAPAGSIVQVRNSSAEGWSLLTITDSGPGIAQAKQQYLFQPFSKAEGAETFTHQGMGFSLYLDKLIMHYVGGDITLQSGEGEGTTVTIAIPQSAHMAQ